MHSAIKTMEGTNQQRNNVMISYHFPVGFLEWSQDTILQTATLQWEAGGGDSIPDWIYTKRMVCIRSNLRNSIHKHQLRTRSAIMHTHKKNDILHSWISSVPTIDKDTKLIYSKWKRTLSVYSRWLKFNKWFKWVCACNTQIYIVLYIVQLIQYIYIIQNNLLMDYKKC